jgi:hypothetical protein
MADAFPNGSHAIGRGFRLIAGLGGGESLL